MSGKWLVVNLNDLDSLILAMAGPSESAAGPWKNQGWHEEEILESPQGTKGLLVIVSL